MFTGIVYLCAAFVKRTPAAGVAVMFLSVRFYIMLLLSKLFIAHAARHILSLVRKYAKHTKGVPPCGIPLSETGGSSGREHCCAYTVLRSP